MRIEISKGPKLKKNKRSKELLKLNTFKNEKYTGWYKWVPTLEEWAEFSVEPKPPVEMYENEYLLVYNVEDGQEKLVSQYQYTNGKLRSFGRGSISYSLSDFKVDEEGNVKESKSSKKKVTTITPLNAEQVAAIDLLNNDNIKFKMLSGNFGSGKTLLTSTKAVQMLLDRKVEKIIWLRNCIGVKNVGSLGFLPGDLLEKVRPWIRPLIDNIKSSNAIMHMIKKEQLEVVALEHLRGANFDNSVVVCTEAQNLDEELMKLIIGRIGKGSYLLVEGDFKQTDREVFNKSQGMKAAIDILAGQPLFGYVDMPKDERSDVARLADLFEKRDK